MKVHHITVSVFSDRGEIEVLKETLKGILPKDSVVEENVIEPETEGGVFTHEMVELKCAVKRQKDVREFTSRILGSLDDYDKRRIIDNLDSFIDDDCNLYMRLSKSEAGEGNFVLESMDSIHVAFKLAAYPAKKEKAVEVARELMEDGVR